MLLHEYINKIISKKKNMYIIWNAHIDIMSFQTHMYKYAVCQRDPQSFRSSVGSQPYRVGVRKSIRTKSLSRSTMFRTELCANVCQRRDDRRNIARL